MKDELELEDHFWNLQTDKTKPASNILFEGIKCTRLTLNNVLNALNFLLSKSPSKHRMGPNSYNKQKKRSLYHNVEVLTFLCLNCNQIHPLNSSRLQSPILPDLSKHPPPSSSLSVASGVHVLQFDDTNSCKPTPPFRNSISITWCK